MTTALANNIQIEYETFGDPSNAPLLLIMGLGGQLIAWDEDFCRQLADSGHFVIIFDNRDVGLSTKFDEAGVPDIMDMVVRMMQGQTIDVPYTINDIAEDAVGLLDALGIEKAHICGISMGGMIAQTLAIHHPQRVRSLISIYSSTGNPLLPQSRPEVLQLLLAEQPVEREAYVERNLVIFDAISGSGCSYDRDYVRKVVERSYDRAFYPQGDIRQFAAIMTQENRKTLLGSVTVPTLVVHGTDDPLVPVEGGKDTAEAIPGAELLIIKGMGHDLPHGECWERIGRAIASHTRKAE